MIDQNPPHGARREAQELRPASEFDDFASRSGPGQAQVNLVHECRGLERVTGVLVAHLPPRQTTQFVVEQGGQAIEGLRIPGVRTAQEDLEFAVHRVFHFDGAYENALALRALG